MAKFTSKNRRVFFKNHNEDIDMIQSLLPHIGLNFDVHKLKAAFLAFIKLVAANRIPMDNSALLLLFGVVKWNSLVSTKTMTYPDSTKLLWRIGMKLFHGSFLNFMSGMKNKGQDTEPWKSITRSQHNHFGGARASFQPLVIKTDLRNFAWNNWFYIELSTFYWI